MAGVRRGRCCGCGIRARSRPRTRSRYRPGWADGEGYVGLEFVEEALGVVCAGAAPGLGAGPLGDGVAGGDPLALPPWDSRRAVPGRRSQGLRTKPARAGCAGGATGVPGGCGATASPSDTGWRGRRRTAAAASAAVRPCARAPRQGGSLCNMTGQAGYLHGGLLQAGLRHKQLQRPTTPTFKNRLSHLSKPSQDHGAVVSNELEEAGGTGGPVNGGRRRGVFRSPPGSRRNSRGPRGRAGRRDA